ncbi:MAG TPA: tetratricopeptide repeat protein [Candidatus Eremiobacteraceae bacterium]|nr:tetratricopeptide repeat protein [Candidatus Eremiobacteraceae bacterium]
MSSEHANFRLAHLLSEKSLATLVVTPNFDDFLPRALTLFGVPHIVCDHPNTVERINPESDEIQIVHVHGTYWFYDGCNLRGEIEARTEDPRERSVTMTSLLGNIFSRHSAIVIGYAGWEGDVIMTALKRRLQSRLPNNLYWFCYRRGDADALPDWLTNHRDARIVLPPALPGKPDSKSASGAKLPSIAAELEPTLTAQSVLDKLVDAFTNKSPTLTLDPIGFFADQLKNSFPLDPSEKPGEDIYALRDVIRRVELAKAGEKEPSPIESQIELARDAVRRSAYLEALQIASQLEPKLSTDAQREALMESVMSAALGLDDNSEAELQGYELALRLATGKVGASPHVREHAALALYNKGVVLSHLNRSEEEIQSYDEFLRRFGDTADPGVRRLLAQALFDKAVTLGQLDRREEEIQAYDEVLRRFGDAGEPAPREAVAKALFNKGATLSQLNRSEDAIHAYGELARRFGDATELVPREAVGKALVNKGVTLGQLNRGEEEIQTYDEVPRRFGDAPEPTLRDNVATALVNKGIALGQLNRDEEEIQTYDEVQRRFGDATEPALREQAAKALLNKGITLGQLNRSEEAIQVYDEVLRRFGDATEPALREQVGKALVNRGVRLGQLNRSEEEIQVYDEVLRRFGDATEPALREQVAKALYCKGLTLKMLERSEEARISFQEVLNRSADPRMGQYRNSSKKQRPS